MILISMRDPQKIIVELPEAFLDRMAGLLGNEYDAFLTSLQHPATTGLRVNTLKLSALEFCHLSPFHLSPVPWCSSGYSIESIEEETGVISPGKHLYHYAGLYYIQEPSAMAVAEALAPQPGDKVLDLAAAPGGKATHLATLMKNTGLLVTNEIHQKRVWDLVENMERCGVTNAIVSNETPRRLAAHFGEYFDRVLLDAPCSGEGMFRKSEGARREWKPELVRSCAIRQAGILEQAGHMVKPGGRIAYTTCTFSAEENEGVIAFFLAQHPEFELESIHHAPGYQPAKPEWVGLPPEHRINRAVRIWPHLARGEGHFIACLLKSGSSGQYLRGNLNKVESLSNRIIKSNLTRSFKTILSDFYRANLTITLENSRLFMDGTYIYHIPEGLPSLVGLKVIRPGWWMGSINKDRFTPSHSFAMGIKSDQAKHILPMQLGDKQLFSYLAGDSLPSSGDNAWVLVTVDGFPIGWGKRVQNVIKNFYPHGLRRLA
jgi:NOL1/NOP2/sun family putative RNA methylase